MRFRDTADVGSLCWRYGRPKCTANWYIDQKRWGEMEIQFEGFPCVSKEVEESTSVPRQSSISWRSRKVTLERAVCGSANVDLIFAR